MYKLQEIVFPLGCEIIAHDFYDYDPELSFNEADNLKYLHEDLLECSFPDQHLVVDLGWYGDAKTNQGEFKIHIILGHNWEVPLNVIYSKSADEIKILLNKILEYYSENNLQKILEGDPEDTSEETDTDTE